MKKVLIVDDQEEVRELVEATLRLENYKIFMAENGETAIKITKEEKPDLVIMDILMPGEIDGLEATRRIKNDPELKQCKIIVLTAKGQKDDIEEGYKSGADKYLVKPFSPQDLVNKVEEMLG